MYTQNSDFSATFVLLSLLSTGLSIVAAGLLVDYSTSLVQEADLFDVPSASYSVPLTDAGYFAHRFLASASENRSPLRMYPLDLTDGEVEDASASSLHQSLVVNIVREEIDRRHEEAERRPLRDLIVVKPAALDMDVHRDVFRTAPPFMEVVSRDRRAGRGG